MGTNLAESEPKRSLEKELKGLIAKQRDATLAEGLNIERRLNRIDRVISLLVENSKPILDALNQDFGSRSPEGSLTTDIFGTISTLKYAKKKPTEME